ncbi:MAG: PocR ligand-binding domain-containing protein [Thermodesulfobacteriota bacterium]
MMSQHDALQDLIDLPKFQNLLDSLYAVVGITTAVIDLTGNILIISGWQDICVRFHRIHPLSQEQCRESDRTITHGLSCASGHVQITCPRGLTDVAIPLVIEGVHLANVFTGQFFLAPPDRDHFRQQAKVFGFDEETYLAALDRVPVISQEKLEQYLVLLANLVEFMAMQGLQHLRSLRAQEELRERETQYRNLANAGSALIWTSGVNKLCNFFNQPWLDFTGRSMEQELGNGWVQGVHPDDLERCLKTYTTAFDRREPFDMEYRLRHHSGCYRWIQDVGTPNFNSKGEFVGYIGYCFDITTRKREEEENAQLQARLNQAQKMEAIGVLAGGIAHDFNNILGPIIGYTEIAREDADSDSQLAYDLDRVLASAHRAKDLIRHILTFSRQSGEERIPLKIQPLLKESLKMLRASIPATITIRKDVSPRCGVVLADPSQVHQIIMNLCTNAFHAMEMTGGVLSVSLKEKVVDSHAPDAGALVPGDYIELTVSDTGNGIGPDIFDQIFDPYFTTKEIGKGTGLGLAIVSGIIKSYGGAVTVESVLGQGATFRVYFPVIHEEAGKHDDQPVVISGGSEQILFVDDEEILAKMSRKMLERMGYAVTVHTSGSEALAVFMEDPDRFDLVITDQTMPGMTGIELAKQILAVRPVLPIILCTGFSSVVDEEDVRAAGIREFALKPLSREVIGRLIRKMCDAAAHVSIGQ